MLVFASLGALSVHLHGPSSPPPAPPVHVPPPAPAPVPNPPNLPEFVVADALSRPASALPNEPMLAGDVPVGNESVAMGEGAAGRVHTAEADGGITTGDAVGTDEWAGMRKLFQRALPFLAIGGALCCSCMCCCGCYLAHRRLFRSRPPPAYWGAEAQAHPVPPAWAWQGAPSWSTRQDCSRCRECRV